MDDIAHTQVTCRDSKTTLSDVPPGERVVELDSRAVTPKVYGTQAITAVAGEEVSVTFDIP